MRITLKIRSSSSRPPTDPQVRVFDSFPIIIGRSSACNYILNDPTRYISSNHAVILLEDSKLLIQDTSANGVYINGDAEPVGRGQSCALNPEDAIAIGDYTLSFTIDGANSSASISSADDPFASFPSSPGSQSGSSAPATFDSFRGDEPDWTPASAKKDDPFSDDWDFDVKPESNRDSLPAESDTDWSDWPSESSSTGGSSFAGAPPQSREPAALSSNNQPTQARNNPAPSLASGIRASAPRGAGSSSVSSGSLETLLNAASLRETDFEHRNSTEVLEQTGKLLVQMTNAMMVLLQSRMEFKTAIRSDVTTLSRSGNNPLKFSYSPSDALTKLLTNKNDGYLPPEKAIQEAVEDLKLHQLAMLEGMKSAVNSLLLQFDPDKLAATLVKTGGISANIPITREAKLWELFCNQYDTIYEEAVSDFGELFGAEFRKAYDKSIKKTGRRPDF